MSRIALALLGCLLGCCASLRAHAGTWSDLWLTREQQAQRLLDSNHPGAAAAMFSDPRRQAYADLRAGQYAKAAELLAPFKDADSQYNRGNALAHAGQLRDALKAYDAALAASPGNPDAIRNRDLVKRALERAQQQAQQQNGANGQSGRGQGQQKGTNASQGGQPDQQSANAAGTGDQHRPNSAAQQGNSPGASQGGTRPPGGRQSQPGQAPNPAQAGNPTQAGNQPQQRGPSQAASGSQAGASPPPGAQSSAAAQAQNASAAGAQPPTATQAQAGAAGANQPNPSTGSPANNALAQAQPPTTQPSDRPQSDAVSAGGTRTSPAADATTAREDAAAGVRYQQDQQARAASSPPNRMGLLDSRAGVRRRSDSTPPQPPSEQSLALDQWLRGIPEDSGELLQRKFLIEHMMRQDNER